MRRRALRAQRMAKVVKGSNRLVASLGVRSRDEKVQQTASIKSGQLSREPAVVLDYTT